MNELNYILAATAVISAIFAVLSWVFPRSPKSPYVGKRVLLRYKSRHEGGFIEIEGMITRETTDKIEIKSGNLPTKIINKDIFIEMKFIDKS